MSTICTEEDKNKTKRKKKQKKLKNLLDCTVDHFEHDKEEDKSKTKKNSKTYLIVLWTTLSTIQKRKAKKMQMIGRPHSSLAGSCAAGGETYLESINHLIILYSRYDLNDPGPYLMSKSCRPILSVGSF